MQVRNGGCLCGAVRYVLRGDLQAVAICHCTHCQRQSGSILSFNVVVRGSRLPPAGRDQGLCR